MPTDQTALVPLLAMVENVAMQMVRGDKMNPFRHLEEPEPTDHEALDAEQDTRAANDADSARKDARYDRET